MGQGKSGKAGSFGEKEEINFLFGVKSFIAGMSMGQGKDRQVSDFGEKEKIALSSVKKAIGFAEKGITILSLKAYRHHLTKNHQNSIKKGKPFRFPFLLRIFFAKALKIIVLCQYLF